MTGMTRCVPRTKKRSNGSGHLEDFTSLSSAKSTSTMSLSSSSFPGLPPSSAAPQNPSGMTDLDDTDPEGTLRNGGSIFSPKSRKLRGSGSSSIMGFSGGGSLGRANMSKRYRRSYYQAYHPRQPSQLRRCFTQWLAFMASMSAWIDAFLDGTMANENEEGQDAEDDEDDEDGLGTSSERDLEGFNSVPTCSDDTDISSLQHMLHEVHAPTNQATSFIKEKKSENTRTWGASFRHLLCLHHHQDVQCHTTHGFPIVNGRIWQKALMLHALIYLIVFACWPKLLLQPATALQTWATDNPQSTLSYVHHHIIDRWMAPVVSYARQSHLMDAVAEQHAGLNDFALAPTTKSADTNATSSGVTGEQAAQSDVSLAATTKAADTIATSEGVTDEAAEKDDVENEGETSDQTNSIPSGHLILAKVAFLAISVWVSFAIDSFLLIHQTTIAIIHDTYSAQLFLGFFVLLHAMEALAAVIICCRRGYHPLATILWGANTLLYGVVPFVALLNRAYPRKCVSSCENDTNHSPLIQYYRSLFMEDAANEEKGAIDNEEKEVIDNEEKGVIDNEEKGVIDNEEKEVIDNEEKEVIDNEEKEVIVNEEKGVNDIADTSADQVTYDMDRIVNEGNMVVIPTEDAVKSIRTTTPLGSSDGEQENDAYAQNTTYTKNSPVMDHIAIIN